MNDYRHILLIKPSSMGDIVHAMPTCAAIRRAYPKARLTWLVKREWVRGLTERARRRHRSGDGEIVVAAAAGRDEHQCPVPRKTFGVADPLLIGEAIDLPLQPLGVECPRQLDERLREGRHAVGQLQHRLPPLPE